MRDHIEEEKNNDAVSDGIIKNTIQSCGCLDQHSYKHD